jgi:hypothetical protein
MGKGLNLIDSVLLELSTTLLPWMRLLLSDSDDDAPTDDLVADEATVLAAAAAATELEDNAATHAIVQTNTHPNLIK